MWDDFFGWFFFIITLNTRSDSCQLNLIEGVPALERPLSDLEFPCLVLFLYRTSNFFRNTVQHIATHCNTLQHTATHFNTLQYIAAHCSTLQHTAAHCNTLQHTAIHCNTLIDWCCFYCFVRNSLVALLEALCARIFSFRFVKIGFVSEICILLFLASLLLRCSSCNPNWRGDRCVMEFRYLWSQRHSLFCVSIQEDVKIAQLVRARDC